MPYLYWPRTETPLSELENAAYCYLFYKAMLHIRDLYYSPRWNLLEWRHQRQFSLVAGELADSLHNLALYSALSFKGLDANQLWRGFEEFALRNSSVGNASWLKYRRYYE